MSSRLDGGYGWLVALGIFISVGFCLGKLKISGLLYVYIRQEFNTTHTVTSTISLARHVTEHSTALLFSFLAEKYGSRPVVLSGAFLLVIATLSSAFIKSVSAFTFTFGFLVGLASAMITNPSCQMLPRYFDSKIGLAYALSLTGASIAPMIMSPTLQWAVDEYGLSGSFFILACFYMQMFVAALLFRDPIKHKYIETPPGNTQNSKTVKEVFSMYKKCLSNKQLGIFYFGYFGVVVAMANWVIFQQVDAEDRGVSDRFQQAMLVFATNLGEVIARILFAVVVQYQVIRPNRLFQGALLAMAILFVVYPSLSNYWAIVAASILYGVILSALIAALFPLVRLCAGDRLDLVGPAVGLISIPNGLGYATIQLGGIVRDLLGSFIYVYYSTTVVLLLGVIAFEILAFLQNTSICQKISRAPNSGSDKNSF